MQCRPETHLSDTRNLDTSCHDARLDLCIAVFLELGLRIVDFALVDFGQESGHVLVNHRREKLLVKRWVTEPLRQTVASIIRPLRVYMGLLKLLLRGNVVPKVRAKLAIEIDLEGDDEQDRWEGYDPQERPGTQAKANG